MSPDFVINALESESFSKYFEMSNAELNSIGAYLFTCLLYTSDAADE